MKTIMHKLIFLLLVLPALASAGGLKGKYTKEKKITKSYTVNSTAGLSVANKFGSIVINTWDEDRTEIEVTITVSSDDEQDAVKKLNGIDVDFEATKSLVIAKTRIANFRGSKTSMEVNYTIKIPKRGTLGLNNQYGGIRLGRIYGGINLNCQYGSVNIEEANSDNNNFDIQYCNGSTIGYLKTGTLKIQYSDMNISSTGKLVCNAEYTDVKVGKAADLRYTANYGDLTVGAAATMTGSSNYGTVKVASIASLINANSNYGDITIARFEKTTKNITINSTYGGITVRYDDNIAFDFECSLDYGNLNGQEGLKFSEKTEKDTKAHYKGYYKSSGQCKIYIKSEFGDISLRKL